MRCVHKINIYHHRHPYPCPFRPTDFPRCLPTKLPLLRYGPFTVTYNTHFYYPAHCWKCWGAPTTDWDAISMIQSVAAPHASALSRYEYGSLDWIGFTSRNRHIFGDKTAGAVFGARGELVAFSGETGPTGNKFGPLPSSHD